MADNTHKLYDYLSSKGHYTKSFEEFKQKYDNEEGRQKLYDFCRDRGYYTKTSEEFVNKFFSGTDATQKGADTAQRSVNTAEQMNDRGNAVAQGQQQYEPIPYQNAANEIANPMSGFALNTPTASDIALSAANMPKGTKEEDIVWGPEGAMGTKQEAENLIKKTTSVIDNAESLRPMTAEEESDLLKDKINEWRKQHGGANPNRASYEYGMEEVRKEKEKRIAEIAKLHDAQVAKYFDPTTAEGRRRNFLANYAKSQYNISEKSSPTDVENAALEMYSRTPEGIALAEKFNNGKIDENQYNAEFINGTINKFGGFIEASKTKIYQDVSKNDVEGLRYRVDERRKEELIENLEKEKKEGKTPYKDPSTGLYYRPLGNNTLETNITLATADKLTTEAQNVLDGANSKTQLEGFFKGLAHETLNIENWLSISKYGKNSEIIRVTKKLDEKGEESLTEDEWLLMEALTAKAAVDVFYANQLNAGYKAGAVTGMSIPFMIEFAILPYSKVESAVGKGIVKFAQKMLPKSAGRFVAGKSAETIVRNTIGRAASAGLFSTTVDQGKILAGQKERMAGQAVVSLGDSRDIKFEGMANQQDAEEAYLNSAIEVVAGNYSERALDPLLGFARGKISKVIRGGDYTISGLGRTLTEVFDNPLMRGAQFEGLFGEYSEEMLNNAMTAAFCSDQNFEDNFSQQQLIETFEGLLPTQFFFSLVGMGRGIALNRSARKYATEERKELMNYFSKYGEIPEGIEDDGSVQALTKEMSSRLARATARYQSGNEGYDKEDFDKEVEDIRREYEIGMSEVLERAADQKTAELRQQVRDARNRARGENIFNTENDRIKEEIEKVQAFKEAVSTYKSGNVISEQVKNELQEEYGISRNEMKSILRKQTKDMDEREREISDKYLETLAIRTHTEAEKRRMTNEVNGKIGEDGKITNIEVDGKRGTLVSNKDGIVVWRNEKGDFEQCTDDMVRVESVMDPQEIITNMEKEVEDNTIVSVRHTPGSIVKYGERFYLVGEMSNEGVELIDYSNEKEPSSITVSTSEMAQVPTFRIKKNSVTNGMTIVDYDEDTNSYVISNGEHVSSDMILQGALARKEQLDNLPIDEKQETQEAEGKALQQAETSTIDDIVETAKQRARENNELLDTNDDGTAYIDSMISQTQKKRDAAEKEFNKAKKEFPSITDTYARERAKAKIVALKEQMSDLDNTIAQYKQARERIAGTELQETATEQPQTETDDNRIRSDIEKKYGLNEGELAEIEGMAEEDRQEHQQAALDEYNAIINGTQEQPQETTQEKQEVQETQEVQEQTEEVVEKSEVELINEMANKLGVEVEISEEKATSEDGTPIEGMFDEKSGKVTIYINNCQGIRGRLVLMHEVVGHYGLRKLFGNNTAAINSILDRVFNGMSAGDIVVRETECSKNPKWNYMTDAQKRHLMAEEHFARTAEEYLRRKEDGTLDKSFMDKVADMFNVLFDWITNKLMNKQVLNYDDLINLVAVSERFLEKNRIDTPMTSIETAEEYNRMVSEIADIVNKKLALKDKSKEKYVSGLKDKIKGLEKRIDTEKKKKTPDKAKIARLNAELNFAKMELEMFSQATNDQIEEKAEQEKIQKEDELYEKMRKKAENEVVAEFRKFWGYKPNNIYYREAEDLLRSYAHIRGVADVFLDSDAKNPQTEDEAAAGVISAYKIAMGNTNSEGQLDKYGVNKGALAYTTGNSADWKEFSRFGRYFTNEPANKEKGVVTWSQACELVELSCEQQHIVMRMSGDEALQEMLSKASVDIYHTTAAAGVSNYILIKRIEQAREAARQWEAENDEWRAQTNSYFSTKLNEEASELSDKEVRFSVRTEPAPKKTGIGYKVFFRGKDGKLYPPMVANPNGEDTPIGIWLNADEGKRAADSKTGRPQVKQGGKGTQGGSGTLAYRPGWHLGKIPYALQFNRKDENGDKTLFPKDFVWAEVEYAMDNNYQEEAMQEGVNANGKFQHSLAGLKRVPVDGYYEYRTNPNPQTDPWIITGAMKVNRILSKEEVDELVRKAGREPQKVEGNDSGVRFAVKVENIEEINKEFNDNLQKQIDGTLEEGFVYQLGMPSGKILSTGMPYLPIELASYQINKKSTDKKHPFNISALKNLVISLQNPIAIFSYGDSTKAQNIIVEISHNNKNFLIGIHIMPDGLRINSIRGLFPKDTEEWLKWIQDGKALRLEKEKVQDYIDSFRRINPDNQRVKDLDLDLVAKVVQNFENPPINSEKNSENLQGGEDVRFSVAIASADPFMSNAAVALESVKQDKVTGEQWLAMLQKNGGLKTEEDKWIGLSDFLKDKKSVTKDELKEYIANNAVKVEDVEYGDNQLSIVESSEEYKQFLERYEELREENERTAFEEICLNYGVNPSDGVFNVDSWGEITIGNAEYAAQALGIPLDKTSIDPTRLKYTTEGLDNKKEIALVVPTIEPYNKRDHIHFGDAGDGRAVAWVRFGDTTDTEGNKVLVIDEIQSKRHQDGREKGYSNEREFRKYRKEMEEKYGQAYVSEMTREEMDKFLWLSGSIPDAPFQKNWHELAMKRMLRYAAENGYDKVAWTTGAQQTERYDLAKQVDEIRVIDNYDNNFAVVGRKQGEILVQEDVKGESGLAVLLGKDMARKAYSNLKEGKEDYLTSDGDVLFEGDDLVIGGEGMKGFYDQMLPRFMDKYGKKWDVKTHDIELDLPNESDRVMHGIDVTDQMKESVMGGQVMFSVATSDYEETNVIREAMQPTEQDRREYKLYSVVYDNFSAQTTLDKVLANEPKYREWGYEDETMTEYFARFAEWRKDKEELTKASDEAKAEYEKLFNARMPILPKYDNSMSVMEYYKEFAKAREAMQNFELVNDFNNALAETHKGRHKFMRLMYDRNYDLEDWQKRVAEALGQKTLETEYDVLNAIMRTSSIIRRRIDEYNQKQGRELCLAVARISRYAEEVMGEAVRQEVKGSTRKKKIRRPVSVTFKREDGSVWQPNWEWRNVDNERTPEGNRRNGQLIAPNEIIELYLQALDALEAQELGLPNRGLEGFANQIGIADSEEPMSAERVVEEFEENIGKERCEALQQAVRNATQFAMDELLRGGLISQDKYNETMLYDENTKEYRRKHYVPQRGWAFESYLDETMFADAMKQAKGRTTLATNPLSYIQIIANSAITGAERNLAKQALYRLARDKRKDLSQEGNTLQMVRMYEFVGKDRDGNDVVYETPTRIPEDAKDRLVEIYQTEIKPLNIQIGAIKARVTNEAKKGLLADKAKIAEWNEQIAELSDKIKEIKEKYGYIDVITRVEYNNQKRYDPDMDSTVSVFVNGQRYDIHINQKSVARNINGYYSSEIMDETIRAWRTVMENPRIGKWSMSDVVKFMSAMRTQFSPVFAARNFIRDAQFAFLMNTVEHNPVFASKVLGYTLSSASLINDFIKNDNSTSKRRTEIESEIEEIKNDSSKSDTDKASEIAKLKEKLRILGLFEEFVKGGAITGYSFAQDIPQLRAALVNSIEKAEREIAREETKENKDLLFLQRIYENFKNTSLGNIADNTKKKAELMSQVSELMTRFGQYRAIREEQIKNGVEDIETAINEAKDITVNFNRSGELAPFLGSLWYFANATLQGGYRIIRAGVKHPTKLTLAYLGYVALGSLMAALQPDDPDDETYIPDYVWRTDLVIGRVRIPLPHFFRTGYYLGANIIWALKGKKTYGESMLDGISNIIDDNLPAPMQVLGAIEINKAARAQNSFGVDWDKTWKKYVRGLFPSLIQPFSDNWLNMSFTGAKIYKEPFNKNISYNDTQMYYKNTNEFVVKLCEMLQLVTGGESNNLHDIGGVTFNPAKVSHTIEGLAGGAPTEYKKLVCSVIDWTKYGIDRLVGDGDIEEMPEVNRTFFIGSFYQPYQQDRFEDAYYWDIKSITDQYKRFYQELEENRDKSEKDEKLFRKWRESPNTKLYEEICGSIETKRGRHKKKATPLGEIKEKLDKQEPLTNEEIKSLIDWNRRWNEISQE